MNMNELTLIVLVHNNQAYLPRVLEHYRSFGCRVLIADSSKTAYSEIQNNNTRYAHLAQPTLLQKLAAALELVDTRYVALVGVDDFLVEEGLYQCYDFLQRHPAFVSAQGNSLLYRKQKRYRYMELLPMYPPEQLDFEISDPNPFKRLHQIFHPYRTIFCAVQHTAVLREGYRAVDKNIRNLFLNEYLTAIVPIMNGPHRELPVFYQVRESADDSGDKLTPNLEVIFSDKAMSAELEIYLQSLAPVLSKHTGLLPAQAVEQLRSILRDYAVVLERQRVPVKKGMKKTIGAVLMKLPVGKDFVMGRRLKQQQQDVAPVLRTAEDKKNLDTIKALITKHAADLD